MRQQISRKKHNGEALWFFRKIEPDYFLVFDDHCIVFHRKSINSVQFLLELKRYKTVFTESWLVEEKHFLVCMLFVTSVLQMNTCIKYKLKAVKQ